MHLSLTACGSRVRKCHLSKETQKSSKQQRETITHLAPLSLTSMADPASPIMTHKLPHLPLFTVGLNKNESFLAAAADTRIFCPSLVGQEKRGSSSKIRLKTQPTVPHIFRAAAAAAEAVFCANFYIFCFLSAPFRACRIVLAARTRSFHYKGAKMSSKSSYLICQRGISCGARKFWLAMQAENVQNNKLWKMSSIQFSAAFSDTKRSLAISHSSIYYYFHSFFLFGLIPLIRGRSTWCAMVPKPSLT